MKIFSKIINDETKELECITCGDTPLEGYSEFEREEAYNGKWYLKGYAPEEPESDRRRRLDALVLTPSDVERALYKAKGMDFEDLKAFLHEQMPTLDIKAVGIEFRARDFWRGAPFGDIRLFDVIGAMLGYTSDDIDYLFVHKELPTKE